MPLLSLGLPTSATAAVILVTFQQYGLLPGPLLLEEEPDLVSGLVAALLIGNVMLLLLNLPLGGLCLLIPTRHFRPSGRVQHQRLKLRYLRHAYH